MSNVKKTNTKIFCSWNWRLSLPSISSAEHTTGCAFYLVCLEVWEGVNEQRFSRENPVEVNISTTLANQVSMPPPKKKSILQGYPCYLCSSVSLWDSEAACQTNLPKVQIGWYHPSPRIESKILGQAFEPSIVFSMLSLSPLPSSCDPLNSLYFFCWHAMCSPFLPIFLGTVNMPPPSKAVIFLVTRASILWIPLHST